MPESRQSRSIRWRLLALMSAGAGVLLLVISLLLWNYSRAAANRTYDLLLSGAALAILERVSGGPDGVTVDIPISAMEILGLAPRDRLVYAVFSRSGGLITGSGDLPGWPGHFPAPQPGYFDADYRGTMFRFVIQRRAITLAERREWVTVQIGQTRDARLAQQISLFTHGLAGLAAISVIGLIAVWFAIRTALYPLRQIERELMARDPSDLTAIDGIPPQEIASLFEAINSFIARLSASRSLNESFIADVAHQTRTALSALQGQLALATTAPSARQMGLRVAKAEAQAGRIVRLTNQLLTNAMVNHRSDQSSLTAVALTPIVQDLIGEFMRDSIARDVSFTLDAEVPPGRDLVLGDAVSIREALRNLIDNALRHGPAANIIDIDLRAGEGDRLVLSVSDAGPGIAPEAREHVTERFVSLSARSGGSGLGLAIVQAVASSHKARLTLERSMRGGLRAALIFPRLSQPRPPAGPHRKMAGLLGLALAIVMLMPGQILAAERVLLIHSATDTDAVAPLLRAFESTHPGIRVQYREFQTRELYDDMLQGRTIPDLVISSAMDLQVDLVNRGLAQPVSLSHAANLPDWAQWRSELYGLTFEPAAIVYDPRAIPAGALPRTHQALVRYIRAHQAELSGRIGTYDVAVSGIGYLFATQDVVQGPQGYRLPEVLGRARLRQFCCTLDMLEAVAKGDLAMAINVIGSYAMAHARSRPNLRVALMDDYNLVMSRAAFVPRGAASPDLAAAYLDFMISPAGQRAMIRDTQLIPIRIPDGAEGDAEDIANLMHGYEGSFLPIPLRPSLLTYLDGLKMRQFIDSWRDATQAGAQSAGERR